jgi:FemAB-related protein (PEP-CTERM system-associated)
MRIGFLTPSDKPLWDQYVDNRNDSTHCHLSGWKDVIENAYQHKGYYIFAKDEDEGTIRGILPLFHVKSLLFSQRLVSLPFLNCGGILADSNDVARLLVSRAVALSAELGVKNIELRQQGGRNCNGCLGVPEEHNFQARSDKVTMILDLPSTAEELWKGFTSKLRNEVRHPQKNEMKVIVGGAELLDDFYDVFSVHMRDLGSPVHSKSFFTEICRVFENRVRLGVVYEKEEHPTSAGFVFSFHGVAEIIWASSLTKYKRHKPNMLLYWAMMESVIETGCKHFDFGRSTMHGNTYRFKKQWGAVPIDLNWHYWTADGGQVRKIDPKSRNNKVAIEVWKKLPVPLSRWLGPKIRKGIPL